jgi:hypothetical protein
MAWQFEKSYKYNIAEKILQHEADFSNLLTLPDQVKYCLSVTSRKIRLESEQKNDYSDFFSGLEIV